MHNKHGIDFVDFIIDNSDTIRQLNNLNINENKMLDTSESELSSFFNKKIMFAVMSPRNKLLGCDTIYQSAYSLSRDVHIDICAIFCETSCECLAFLDSNLDDDTVFLIYYKSLKVSKTQDVGIAISINTKKVLKLKV